MKYRFSTNPYGQKDILIKVFGVDLDSLTPETWALNGIAWDDWTPQEIQMIIDKSKALQGNQEYEYQVVGSDLLIIIDKNEAHFFDAYSEQEEADIIWSFDKFIDFMEQFKKFVEDNS